MSEWRKVKLSDLSLNISSGLTPLKSNSDFWNNPEIPWLKTEQLGEKYIYDANVKISKKALENTSLKLYPENTLTIAMYGEGKTRGNVSIIKKAMTTNQACCNIEINPKIADVEYVYYYLKTQYNALRNLSSGVRNNLNSKDIKNFEIRIPESLLHQRKLISILKLLDDKISLNNQINEQLEEMAKTLYDYWFVQFNFPDENGKPYKSSGGKMVYHDQLKREIPEGWRVTEIASLTTLVSGYAFSSTTYSKQAKYKLYTIKNVQDGYIISKVDNCIEVLPKNMSLDCLLKEGDLLMSLTGNVGRIGLVYEENALLNQRLLKIIVNDRQYFSFIYNLLKSKGVQLQLENMSTGTSQKNLSPRDISSLKVILPTNDIIKKFDDLCSRVIDITIKNTQQNQELTQLRDWLLPMLMNGQVRVE